MYQTKGHALLVAIGAVGVGASFIALDTLAPAAARPGQVAVAALREAGVEPVLKPLPASPEQTTYTRVLLSPADREALAREIQRELNRVGCYRGDIDGQWGPQSRQAMGAFTVGMKLRIPFDAPDEMLLRVVKGQMQRVCGGPDLDPEQAAATPGTETPPRLVQPPTEVKRPRRTPAGERQSEMRVAEIATTNASPPRRAERTSPPPAQSDVPPKIVRNLLQTVSGVLAPFGF